MLDANSEMIPDWLGSRHHSSHHAELKSCNFVILYNKIKYYFDNSYITFVAFMINYMIYCFISIIMITVTTQSIIQLLSIMVNQFMAIL